jgi:hypothetical protein
MVYPYLVFLLLILLRFALTQQPFEYFEKEGYVLCSVGAKYITHPAPAFARLKPKRKIIFRALAEFTKDNLPPSISVKLVASYT